MKLPRNVTWFVWLYLASFILPMLGLPSSISRHVAESAAEHNVNPAPVMMFVIGGLIFIFVFVILLVWLVVWKRRNWARWVLFLLFLTGVANLLWHMPSLYSGHVGIAVLLAIPWFVQAVAFYFLFTGDAVHWYRTNKRAPAIRAD